MMIVPGHAAALCAAGLFAVIPPSGEAGKILQRHDYFTSEALAAADMEGLDAEIAAIISKCDREFAAARETAAALAGHDRLAVERRLEIAERLKRHVAARSAAAERDERILAWQGAQDLDLLFGYFRREARRLAERRKAPAPTVFSVRDFGATGDGRTDDAPAFRRALEAVAALKGAPTVLKVPAGTYRLTADPRCPCNDFTQHDWQTGDNRGAVRYWSWTKERLHLFLLNLENLVIRGEGESTVIAFDDSGMGGFGFHGCYNTFIENLTVDYPNNPSTQGTVEAVEDTFALVFRRQEGYPDPDCPRFLKAFSRYFSPLAADGRYRPTGVGRLGTVERLGEGRFRLVPQPRHANDPVWRSMKAGDRMCIVARYAETGGASPVKSVWSAFCGLRNVRFLDSPGQMVWGSGSYAFSVVGCRGTGRDGSDDVVTGNADSILLGGLIGPYVSDCVFRGLEDDGINVCCNTGEVTAIPADRLFRQSHTNGSQPAAGGLLSDGQSAKIKMFLRYKPCRGGDAPGTNCDCRGGDAPGTNCDVATRPMPADTVSAANRGARPSDKLIRVPNTTGAVLRNTEYSGLRGRGIQVHCGNMLIENVKVRDVTGVGISVHALISWSMCYDIYNVLVRNCRFERVGGGHAASTHPEEIKSAGPMEQRMHFNIAFENCTFDPGPGKTGVYVANADEVRVSGCTFGPGCSDPPVRTNRATRVTVDE